MLWKFKKASPSEKTSNSQESRGVHSLEGERSVGEGATSVVTHPQNEDRMTRYPAGAYIVPTSYKVSGSVVTSRPVVIEGDLRGALLVAPSVTVTARGVLQTPTQASSVFVDGVVKSHLVVRDVVEVRAGGKLEGDVEAGALKILPGGVVSGARLSIGPLRGRERE